MKKLLNIAFYVILFFYLLIMLDLLFRFRVILNPDRIIARSFNLVPLKTIFAYLSNSANVSSSLALKNLLGNIVVFIPFGLYVQALIKKSSLAKNVIVVAVSSIAVELIQLALAVGALDIDDVILNTLGGLVGILLFRLLTRIFKDDGKAKNFVTIASLIVGVPLILFYFIGGIMFAS